jgi:[1-hydroxy-2-(trimethylamino)ethyl]phosphonate dioxygenase
MTRTEFVDKIASLFATRGNEQYAGEAVSQLEHALQGALLAEAAGAPSAEIAAVLLHDIGHLLHNLGDDCAEHGVDDKHEELGIRFLAKHLPPTVTEPIRLHVAAKRYLCSTDAGYFGTLSPASVTSLKLQGGPMSADEVRAFEANPHYRAAVALRKRDDEAKTPKLPTPPFDHYRPHLEACLVG